MSESSRSLFFAQLSETAPAIEKVLNTYPSRIRAEVLSGDALNGYGTSLVFQVYVEVLTYRCKGCGETQFSAPNAGECRNHRFAQEWREISSAQGDNTEEALFRADKWVSEWLGRRK